MSNILTVNEHKLFTVNNRTYVYNVISGSIFQIDDLALWVLSCDGMPVSEFRETVEKREDKSQILSLMNGLTSAGLIRSNKIEMKETSIPKADISALTLMVAQECNLRCKYCYGEGGEYSNRGKMSVETAKAAVDFLVENATTDDLKIAFLGGEPLMNMPVIESTVNYCNDIEKKTGKKFSYTITTNAVLLNDKIRSFLIENHITCQISIDGDKRGNDLNRVAVDGSGSYDRIIRNTDELRNRKLVSARATLSAENMGYKSVFDHLYSLGFRAIPMAVAHNTISESDFSGLLDEYSRYIDYFEELLSNKDLEKAGKMTDLINGLEKIEYSCERNEGCGAGRYMRAIDINGTMYPCHRFVGNAKFALGNIHTGAEENPESDRLIFGKKEKCSSCWCRNLCLGGCHYENAVSAGESDVSLRVCEMTKLMYEKLIRIYLNISPDVMERIRYFYEHRNQPKEASAV